MSYLPRPILERLAKRVTFPLDPNGCFECTLSVANGYPRIWFIRENGERGLYKANRFSWEFFYGPIPDGLWVLHRCDNRKCIRPDHLFLGNASDNQKDMVAKGRSAKGQKQGSSKLKDSEVLEIKKLLHNGYLTKRLGELFNVTTRHIWAIKRGLRWRHINVCE